jgi:hypothetical protein
MITLIPHHFMVPCEVPTISPNDSGPKLAHHVTITVAGPVAGPIPIHLYHVANYHALTF